MERYEFLVLPARQVLPFDVTQPYRHRDQRRGDGDVHRLDEVVLLHLDRRATRPSPCPCGFTPEGLPVGLQIVGRHQDDWGVLQLAHAFEGARSGRPGTPDLESRPR